MIYKKMAHKFGKSYKSILIMLLALIFGCCSNFHVLNEEERNTFKKEMIEGSLVESLENSRIASDLCGSWQLTEVCNWAWGDGCKEVTNEDPVVIIIFDDNGNYLEYNDNSLFLKRRYKIISRINTLNRRFEDFLKIENLGDYSFSFGDDGRLYLSLNAYDAGSAVYTRVS